MQLTEEKKIASPPHSEKDKPEPIEQWCQKVLEQLADPDALQLSEISPLVLQLAEAMHRYPALQTADWHVPLFLKMSAKLKLHYLQTLKKSLPYDERRGAPPSPPAVLERLSNAPDPSGRRIKMSLERKNKQSKIVASLVTPTASGNKTQLAEVPQESKAIPSASKEFSLSVPRAQLRQGTWKVQVQTHQLASSMAEQLFLPNGEWQANKQVSGKPPLLSIRTSDGPQLNVKRNPRLPIHELDSRFGLSDAPGCILGKFHSGEKTYAAWVSEGIVGAELSSVIKKNSEQLKKIDFANFAKTLLVALLLNSPNDSYYLVRQHYEDLYKLVRLDNKLQNNDSYAFLPKSDLPAENIIYSLEQMQWNWYEQPAVKALLEDFLSIQPVALLKDLLIEASQQRAAGHALCGPEVDFFIPSEFQALFISLMTAIQTHIRLIQGSSVVPVLTGQDIWKATQLFRSHHANIFSIERASAPPEEIKTSPSSDEQGSTLRQPIKPSLPQTGYSFASGRDLKVGRRSSLPNTAPTQSFYQQLHIPHQWQDASLKAFARQLRLSKATTLSTHKLDEKLSVSQQDDWWKNHQRQLKEDFQRLPLPLRELIWNNDLKPELTKGLPLPEQTFLLAALTGTDWQVLDLSQFAPELITNQAVTALLKGSKQPILDLDLSNCIHLTADIAEIIHHYCPYLKRLRLNHQVNWEILHIGNFDGLIQLECSNASHLQRLTFGNLPALQKLVLKNAIRLPYLIDFSDLIGQPPYSLPELRRINVSGCVALRKVSVEVNDPDSLVWWRKGCTSLELPESHASAFKALNLRDSLALENHSLFSGAYNMLQGHYAEAVIEYTRALYLSTAAVAPEVYIKRARAKIAQGDPQGAIADYNKVIRFWPKKAMMFHSAKHLLVEAYYQRGRLNYLQWEQLGDSPAGLHFKAAAIKDGQKALIMKPSLAVHIVNFLQNDEKLNKNSPQPFLWPAYESIVTSQRLELIEQQAQEQFLLSSGTSKMSQGNYLGAIADYTQAIHASSPAVTPELYIKRGNAKAEQGDYTGAIADYSHVIHYWPNRIVEESSPGTVHVRNILAQAHYYRGCVNYLQWKQLGESTSPPGLSFRAAAMKDYRKAERLQPHFEKNIFSFLQACENSSKDSPSDSKFLQVPESSTRPPATPALRRQSIAVASKHQKNPEPESLTQRYRRSSAPHLKFFDQQAPVNEFKINLSIPIVESDLLREAYELLNKVYTTTSPEYQLYEPQLKQLQETQKQRALSPAEEEVLKLMLETFQHELEDTTGLKSMP